MQLIRNGNTGLRGLQKQLGRSGDGDKGVGLRGGCAIQREVRLGQDWKYGRLNSNSEILC